VYIVADMEGISGVSGETVVRVGHPEWAERGRHYMAADVNAAVEGAVAAGAERIWVRDAHAGGDNLVRERVHAAAHLISGAGAVPSHLPGLDETFDAVFLVGFHARMGTARAQMDHTITTAAVDEVRLNGVVVGEIGMYAAYAGIFGVPVALVTGDAAAARESEALLGDVRTVAVQEAYGRFSSRLLSFEEARAAIREAATAAGRSRRAPWRLETPITVAVDFLRSAEADMAENVPLSRRTGPRTVEYTSEAPDVAFRALQALVHLGGLAAHRWATIIYGSGSRIV
jgi:D-amino peptidase